MEKQAVQTTEQKFTDTLLVVDDDFVNRMVLDKIFSRYYQVEEAKNGREGLEKILEEPGHYSAVLLDVMMPEMTGIEVLRALKTLELLDKLPVFLITAEQGADVVQEAYGLGVMDVLHKPVVGCVVLRRVQSVIELFKARAHLTDVAKRQSVALQKQAEQITRLNQGMLEALATAIEFRNEESGGHVQRISQITRILLEDTSFGKGLSAQEIENIATASILHDVGKIMISDEVLTKPGKLTPQERRLMESHTINGMAILENIPHLRGSEIFEYACDIARHHHERWDGGGYPDGLAGDAISPWAQVVALADVYDALSCRRVYRPPFPRDEVLQTIQSGECGIFNPWLLECFLSVEGQLYDLYEDLLPCCAV